MRVGAPLKYIVFPHNIHHLLYLHPKQCEYFKMMDLCLYRLKSSFLGSKKPVEK